MPSLKLQTTILLAGAFISLPCLAEDAPSGDLRKREHVLSWEYSSSSVKVKPEGADTAKTSSGEFSIQYGRNFGWWSLGGGLGSDVSKDDNNDETSVSTLFLEARGNFVENRPGKDLIPFGYMQLGKIGGETESGATTTDISGNGLEFGLGLDWFPFGELFALNVTLGFLSAEVDYENSGTTVEADFDSTGLSVGYKLFY